MKSAAGPQLLAIGANDHELRLQIALIEMSAAIWTAGYAGELRDLTQQYMSEMLKQNMPSRMAQEKKEILDQLEQVKAHYPFPPPSQKTQNAPGPEPKQET